MAQTQNLILRIVAQRGEIGSAELVEVAQKFGLTSDAARAAANRMAKSGFLTKTGRGRGHVRYKVGPRGQTLIERFTTKLERWHMILEGQLTWDGGWLVVTFSVPEGERGKRDRFRSELEEMGFGLLSTSVWISPFDQEDEVMTLVEELGLNGWVASLECQRIRVPGVESASDLVCRVWDLNALADRYHDLNKRIEALQASLEQAKQIETIGPEALFFEAMSLQSELLDVIFTEDPFLPPELLPDDWPSQRTHELIHAITNTVDHLDLAGSHYEYLFYLLQGMEVLEAFRLEGYDGFRWPSERSEHL
jgi:phenylacetic acid degradation operon negative regulatory protein